MAIHPKTHILGYPRMGGGRELKQAVEAYWAGETSRRELEGAGRDLRRSHWIKLQVAGVDLIPSNDFSYYDHVLDTTCLVGNIPGRFRRPGGGIDLDTAFALARGVRSEVAGAAGGIPACEMTKWFDTNYHYIVPEFSDASAFSLAGTKPFDEFSEALQLGIRTKPVLLGPVTYLSLGKGRPSPSGASFEPLALLEPLLAVYGEILRRLADLGAEWVQLDEPVGVLDLDPARREALRRAYDRLARSEPRLKLLVATYFGGLGENRDLFFGLPVAAIHLDAVRGSEEVDAAILACPEDKILSLGLVDGRNIWRNEYSVSLPVIERAVRHLGAERVMLAPSCSLLHVPVSLALEPDLDPEIGAWMAFADEKVSELVVLRDLAGAAADPGILQDNRECFRQRRNCGRVRNPDVRERLRNLRPSDARRHSPFAVRQPQQRARLKLPAFPTTTIGSFPQTREIRAARARWKRGTIGTATYEAFLQERIRECVRAQEEAGLDVLVHGEFERNDMVEFFGERLEGFVFTRNGWVQSYGSRCVKPPVIYGDVRRIGPMTVAWSRFAQGLTTRPMKGMLTGPLTILQWSFVRDDQPRMDTTRQIALALRDEVLDLESAGIPVIQIDEPGLREGLPLRRKDWEAFLAWATEAFRIASSGVQDATQIHTHMCYAEFNDIIEAIASLDADVITLESSRSNREPLRAFESFRYPNEIGPGVWDIHSPRVPPVEEITGLLRAAAALVPPGNLWVNPDCGLKTRDWPEVMASLRNLVAAAGILREERVAGR
jgi:5-methyltetrahydropteroyltriglutamate--homocysteine methyltransferase